MFCFVGQFFAPSNRLNRPATAVDVVASESVYVFGRFSFGFRVRADEKELPQFPFDSSKFGKF